MNDDDRLIANWCAISGTVYLVMVFAVGLILGNKIAWVLAIAAMGVNYMSYSAQLLHLRPMIPGTLVIASFMVGATAGLALLR